MSSSWSVGRGESTHRERLGQVQAGCELREEEAAGGRRHHYFRAVLRDLVGNVWECADHHVDQDAAHQCARAEFERQIGSGQIKVGRRQAT